MKNIITGKSQQQMKHTWRELQDTSEWGRVLIYQKHKGLKIENREETL